MVKSKTFWDGRAEKYDREISRRDAEFLERSARLNKLLCESDDVLDIGCGSGEIALDLSSQVRHITGVDVSSSMIAIAQEKAQSRSVTNVEFKVTPENDIIPNNTSYSAILGLSVLHLVPSAEKLLATMFETLNRDGLLVVETPCLADRSLLMRLFVAISMIIGLAPKIRSFRANQIERMVLEAGFDVTERSIRGVNGELFWIVARKPNP